VVSIILCQYQFAQFTISLDIVYRWTLCFVCRSFYRAMHFSAKRGIAIACRLSVRLSVRPSVRV